MYGGCECSSMPSLPSHQLSTQRNQLTNVASPCLNPLCLHVNQLDSDIGMRAFGYYLLSQGEDNLKIARPWVGMFSCNLK